jgi:cytoskeletal protein RodZ
MRDRSATALAGGMLAVSLATFLVLAMTLGGVSGASTGGQVGVSTRRHVRTLAVHPVSAQQAASTASPASGTSSTVDPTESDDTSDDTTAIGDATDDTTEPEDSTETEDSTDDTTESEDSTEDTTQVSSDASTEDAGDD